MAAARLGSHWLRFKDRRYLERERHSWQTASPAQARVRTAVPALQASMSNNVGLGSSRVTAVPSRPATSLRPSTMPRRSTANLRSIKACAGDAAVDWDLVEDTDNLWHLVRLPPPPVARYELLKQMAAELHEVDLQADGIGVKLALSPEEVYSTVLPLVEWIRETRREARRDGRHRVLIGVGGGGGSGKTTLAKILREALNLLEPGCCEVLGMDAYHLPNDVLDAKMVQDPNSSETVPLRRLKGTPPSFDVGALVADLQRLANPEAGAKAETVALPEYDRNLHDPVAGRVLVGPDVEVVLVEGLFVVGYNDGMWSQVSGSLDSGVMVRGHQPTIKARMLTRQTNQGKSLAEAESHYERVDGANVRRLEECYSHAAAVLEFPRDGGFLPVAVENVRPREASVMVLGLNPALQKTMWLPELSKASAASLRHSKVHVTRLSASVPLCAGACQPAARSVQAPVSQRPALWGKVCRASKVAFSVGGKGQGAARAAGSCAMGTVVLAQFLGGDSGRFLEEKLLELGLCQVTAQVPAATRTATTVICEASGTATELVDPSATIDAEVAEEMLAKVKSAMQHVKAVAISGTCPPGVTTEFYAEVAQAASNDTSVVLDGYKDVETVLHTGKVSVLKINCDELLELTGASNADEAAKRCFEEYLGASAWLAVTDGASAATMYSSTTKQLLPIPPLEAVNPIGAGDTCAGIMAYCLARGAGTVPDAFAMGLAAACASCLEKEGATFETHNVHSMLAYIQSHMSTPEIYA
ncbi:hypothetical protein CYMTET_11579 [Cymbomonas tetramitiformis]|uniref:Carbohydrate kinase PfkB domain-containing protein n=1 Tax=Cymbomonas tetramitiformis TaxID=36881 RepID=A0AAE0GLT5_9CHLO|nr:hypothetical protein CYMTET_11579 [Cymbomonas tetramitiformis]